MIWTGIDPSDDIKANTLDQAIRKTKVLIRERGVVYNGSYDEHSFYGANVDGTHPLSQVGWVDIWDSYDDMILSNSPNGSLNYVIDEGLYVNDAGTYILIVTADHTSLFVGTDDSHTQYYLKTSARVMATAVKMDAAIVEGDPGTADDNPMPASHKDLSWWDAHGVDSEFLIGRHFNNTFQTNPVDVSTEQGARTSQIVIIGTLQVSVPVAYFNGGYTDPSKAAFMLCAQLDTTTITSSSSANVNSIILRKMGNGYAMAANYLAVGHSVTVATIAEAPPSSRIL